jgi:large subunit ribosomal protein L11
LVSLGNYFFISRPWFLVVTKTLQKHHFSCTIRELQVGYCLWNRAENNLNLKRMAKKLVKKIKVQAVGGKATPAPPLGPVLGQAGINIGEFVNQFNEQTRSRMGEVVPVELSVFDDRTFTFITKVSPMSRLILKKLGKDKGSSKNAVQKVGKLTQAQVREIAEEKMPDLNAANIETAMKTVAGTARSMGIDVE